MTRAGMVKVWDIAVRLFHWALVVCFVVAYASGDDENRLHIWSGYAIIGLLLFRVVWGFIGTRYARFSSFIYGPGTVLKYAGSLARGKPVHYPGHNPAGGWMVILLLLSLIATSWTGLEVYGAEGHGPLAYSQSFLISSAMANDDNEDGKESHEWLEELHEVFANLTLLLVLLHIIGVLIACRVEKENIIKSMFTGYKKDRQ